MCTDHPNTAELQWARRRGTLPLLSPAPWPSSWDMPRAWDYQSHHLHGYHLPAASSAPTRSSSPDTGPVHLQGSWDVWHGMPEGEVKGTSMVSSGIFAFLVAVEKITTLGSGTFMKSKPPHVSIHPGCFLRAPNGSSLATQSSRARSPTAVSAPPGKSREIRTTQRGVDHPTQLLLACRSHRSFCPQPIHAAARSPAHWDARRGKLTARRHG